MGVQRTFARQKKNLADIDGHAAKAAVDGRQTAVEQLQTVERRTWTEDCGQKTVGAAYANAALLMSCTRRETLTQVELDMFSCLQICMIYILVPEIGSCGVEL